METLAILAFVFVACILILGGCVAWSFGGGEGFWTYVVLFLVSQISGIGGILWIGGVLAVLVLGSDKARSGAWCAIAFVAITTGGLFVMFAPYFHMTLGLF